MSDYWGGLIWLVVLLALNAFFVGAEFAVISAKRSQIEPLAEKGKKSAKTALWAMEHATLMLATSQLGITVCSLLILNVSEPAIHHLLQYPLGLTGLDSGAVDLIAFLIALILVSCLHVVLGEMVPKNFAFSVPDKAVLVLATPLVWVSNIFKPVIVSLNGIANGVLRLFRVEPKAEAASTFTLEEVETIINQSTREGVLADTTGALIAAFEFTEKTVADVALPIEIILTLPEQATPIDLEHMVAQHGFSRYILVSETAEPVGYVHVKDILGLEGDEGEEAIPSKHIRRLIPLHPEMELEDALTAMRKAGSHLAQVINAEGETTAILFLEDIIEVLVGEVRDATRREKY